MTFIINGSCIDVKDGICTTSCPVDCIYEGERMFYIHPTECIECGMCESICPVDAIRHEGDVADDEKLFIKINAEAFYDTDGNMYEPGGWSKKHPAMKDPPSVAIWPDKAL